MCSFTSTLLQALLLLFHKVYQALFFFTQKVPGKKKVPGNQVPRFPHIPHPWGVAVLEGGDPLDRGAALER